MNEHSKLPPSSAARRIACPGSRKMEELYPREESDSAKEGTFAHSICSMMLQTNTLPDGLDKDMVGFCELYADYVLNTLIKAKEKNPYVDLHIEEKVDISNIHPQCWGTPDAWFMTSTDLHVFDFKYGFKAVEVYENYQLLEYAFGILGDNKDVSYIHMHIVQPRAMHREGPIRVWRIGRDVLEEYRDKIKQAEYLAMQDLAPLDPSSQCANCKARHACPALQSTLLNHLNVFESNMPSELNDTELGNELRLLHHCAKLLDARVTALEEEAIAKLKGGKRVPFYELGEVQSRERWKKSIEEVLAMGDLFDVDLGKPREAITPKQAIKAGVPMNIVREYSETPRGAVKLQPINELKLKEIFK